MIAVPVAIPFTVPDPTVAMAVLLLLHAPPEVASAKVEVKLRQTLVVPVIEAGKGLTVTVINVGVPQLVE
jgi:hypothetical protein